EGVKPVSIPKARAEEPRFEEEVAKDETVGVLLDIAEKVEGLYRNASTHAAGVVIGDRPLTQLVPLYRDPKSEMPATQYNMKWVEQAGLVKFDFLGLKTLTVIQNAVDLLKLRGVDLDINAIDLADKATYALYGRADTVGVFQVESAGMRDALRQLQPTCIEDIVALVALYRPGPMENIPLYCDVKNERRARASIHPLIDPILDETQGIIVYQEQVMEIARKMAGYSLGGADMLRRAMGKKIQAAMDAERPKFLAGAAENGVDKKKAQEVWDLLDKFANYGFNKSHAAAYGLVSYQTAWLKATHPVEFMAAVMNLDINLTDKLTLFVSEARRLDIEVTAPCINRSDARFTVREGRIPYALGALKGVGIEAMLLVEKARAEGGVFSDLEDFARRVDLRLIGKRALEMIVRAGALDALEPNRRRILESLDALVLFREESGPKEGAMGDLLDVAAVNSATLRLSEVEDWLPRERLKEEQAAVGFYLSGHPLDIFTDALARHRVLNHRQFLIRRGKEGGGGRIAGTLGAMQVRKSARGTRFAYLQFSDTAGGYEVMAFSDVLAEAEALLKPGANLVLTVETEGEAQGGRIMLRAVQTVDEVIASSATGLMVYVNSVDAFQSLRRRLDRSVATATESGARRALGRVRFIMALPEMGHEVEVVPLGQFPVGPEIRGMLKDVPGVEAVVEV
ncbi:MAG: DNA polymerase III subunit alpha, partial [Pseudomonadota bacterium]